MNHTRRDELAKLQESFNTFWNDARTQLDAMMTTATELRDDLDTIKDEEQAAFDALNAGLQAAERGQQMEAAIEAMQEIYDTLDSMVVGLDDVDDLPSEDVNANFDVAMG